MSNVLSRDDQDKVRKLVARIETLEAEKKALGDDIKEIYAEAKSQGYPANVLRAVIRRRKMDAAKRDELDMLIQTYEGVLS